MDIKNVLSDDELQDRYDVLKAINPLISKMEGRVHGNSARDKINGWFIASRKDLLFRLSIREHESYKGLYLDNTGSGNE